MHRSDIGRINPRITIQPGFRAHLAGSAVTASGGVETKLSATGIAFNNAEGYDGANARFYPAINGVYHIAANINFISGLTSGQRVYARLYKNGAPDHLGQTVHTGTATGIGASVNAHASLTATEYVEVYWLIGSTATNIVIDGSTPATYWSAVRVA